MQECPYCYTKVLPDINFNCPSCGKNIRERNSEPSKYTVASIKDTQKLPDLCYNCGTLSNTNVVFKAKRQNKINPDDTAPLQVFSGVGMLVYYLIKRIAPKTDLLIRIPVCYRCKNEHKKIKPRFIDFEHSRVDLVVHKRFKEKLNANNK